MDIRQVRYFMEVARELNITHAAEKLHIAQPPLSRMIQQLEEELQVQLFKRDKRKLSLTEEGEILLHRGEQILTLFEKTEQEIRDHGKGVRGTIYIGTVEGNAPHILSGWIADFAKKYPKVHYNLWNGSTDEVVSRLSKGICDLGLIMTPYDKERLNGITICSEPWAAMIPCDHPLAKAEGSTVRLRDLVGEPLIIPARKSRSREIAEWFDQTEGEMRILAEISNYMNAYELVRNGVGIAIFPASQDIEADKNKVVTKSIEDPSYFSDYVLVWEKNRVLKGLPELFVTEIDKD